MHWLRATQWNHTVLDAPEEEVGQHRQSDLHELRYDKIH